MRKYQPVWNILKTKKVCTLEVLPALVARVKKGVIKEKDQDTVFKLLNDHDHFFLEFSYDPEKRYLTIKLRQSLGLEGIRHELVEQG